MSSPIGAKKKRKVSEEERRRKRQEKILSRGDQFLRDPEGWKQNEEEHEQSMTPVRPVVSNGKVDMTPEEDRSFEGEISTPVSQYHQMTSPVKTPLTPDSPPIYASPQEKILMLAATSPIIDSDYNREYSSLSTTENQNTSQERTDNDISSVLKSNPIPSSMSSSHLKSHFNRNTLHKLFLILASFFLAFSEKFLHPEIMRQINLSSNIVLFVSLELTFLLPIWMSRVTSKGIESGASGMIDRILNAISFYLFFLSLVRRVALFLMSYIIWSCILKILTSPNQLYQFIETEKKFNLIMLFKLSH